MEFYNNFIPTGNSAESAQKYFEKLASQQEGQKMVKTASKEDEVSSGQLDVEPLHQKGDSECAPKSKGGKSKEDDEAEGSGQLEVEPLHQKGESEKAAESNKETKQAGSDCMDGDEDDKEDKDEDKKDDDKEEKDEDKDDDGLTEGQKKLPEALQKAIKDKKASTNGKLIVLAKLTPDQRKMLATYWGNLYDKEYVDALLEEK
jgi:hypothetical protein